MLTCLPSLPSISIPCGGLDLKIALAKPSRCWNYRCAVTCLACFCGSLAWEFWDTLESAGKETGLDIATSRSQWLCAVSGCIPSSRKLFLEMGHIIMSVIVGAFRDGMIPLISTLDFHLIYIFLKQVLFCSSDWTAHDVELTAILPQPLRGWGYRSEPPCLVFLPHLIKRWGSDTLENCPEQVIKWQRKTTGFLVSTMRMLVRLLGWTSCKCFQTAFWFQAKF